MKPFTYVRATESSNAIQTVTNDIKSKFIAGGTNLIDLMKEGVEQPDRLVDTTQLDLSQIQPIANGVRIGALARNSDTANHPLIRTRYPLLSQALLAGASPQLRNMATLGGNLMQRTRCYYFYNTATPCNKRTPGSGCAAIEGYNRIHAILGTSDKCIATHPSDMCVALAALDAVVQVSGAKGNRAIPFTEFHRLPGDTPQIDTVLQQGELIVAVDLPNSPFAERAHYLKVRDRASYAFALVSVATALDINNGVIQDARMALGGVAHKPWRAIEAEQILRGAKVSEQTFKAAADATLKDAKSFKHNKFKIVLAAIAAQRVQRPVKLVLTRQQMFTSVGCRPHSLQRIRLGANRDGKLTAVAQEITTQTSISKEFVEHIGAATNTMYNAPNVLVTHRAVPLNIVTPTIMRAPGETPGMYALESALDELAYKLNIDPVELRIINDPPQDPEKNLPWSSRSLVQSLREGAKRFGWTQRNPKPASMREGRYLVGYGVASATYPTNRQPASALAKILADGRVLIQIAATDIGTGTYTILTQVAAEALSVAPSKVQVQIGDTQFPKSPGSGGSWGAASYGSAVHEACMAVRSKLNASPGETYEQALARRNLKEISAQVESKPDGAAKKYSMHAFGAQFAEVRVDPDLGMVKVTRFLGVFGAGRILNPKTAKSQMIGGIVWGISQALHEETHLDERYGNFVNNNLGEYHVPVNADIPNIDIMFLDEKDPYVNPLGVKGVGEIGIVGTGAAVANAIYHATGKRIRDLPITPDKLC